MRDYDELVKDLRKYAELVDRYMWDCPYMIADSMKQAADAIEELLSSVEVEPVKRGKWMEMGTNADGTHNIKCSECGAGYKTKGHANSILTKAKYKFCPQCGAKMGERREDGDGDG